MIRSLVLGVLLVASALAQGPAFEVASIKVPPMDSGAPLIAFTPGPQPGGRWVARNETLSRLLQAAYDGFTLPGQIVGTPAWATTTRFDINAIAAGDPPRRQMNEMARQLFADRFRLRVRIEPRDMDVYALVLHRRDGRLGPRLKRSTADCAAIRGEGAPGEQSPDPTRPACRQMMTNTESGLRRLWASASPLSGMLIDMMPARVGRPVVDRTGLTGAFDIELEFADERSLRVESALQAGPSIFVALQEQLGLRLESRKEKIDVLVIESVDMPTPD